MTREDLFEKNMEYDAWQRLMFAGPRNTQELIAAFLIQMHTFFVYAGAMSRYERDVAVKSYVIPGRHMTLEQAVILEKQS